LERVERHPPGRRGRLDKNQVALSPIRQPTEHLVREIAVGIDEREPVPCAKDAINSP
jgi:hypothetical protein